MASNSRKSSLEPSYRQNSKEQASFLEKIPAQLHDTPIFQAFIQYFISATPDQYESTRSSIYFVLKLSDFILANFTDIKSIPDDLIARFERYMSITKNNAPNSLRCIVSKFRIILKWGTQQPFFANLSEHDRRHYLSTISKIPFIPISGPDTTRTSLSEIIDGYQVDDLVLLDSFNNFCRVFLEITQRHRKYLTSDPRISERINHYKNHPIAATQNLKWDPTKKHIEDYTNIFQAICESDDITLKERLLFSSSLYRETLLDLALAPAEDEIDRHLSTCIFKNGNLRRSTDRTHSLNHVTFYSLDFQSILSPTEEEDICLRWLLASDRIQGSAQEKLSLDDFLITPSHCTISFIKKRSKNAPYTSTAYRKKSWQYKTFDHYICLRNFQNSAFPQEASNSFFVHSSPFQRPQHFNSRSFRMIVLACMPSSHLHKEIIEKAPNANYFIKLMAKVFNEGTVHEYNNSLAEGRQPKLLLIPDNPPPTPKVLPGLNRLTTSAFAQSRAIVDHDETPTITAFDRYAKEVVSADSTAHSSATKEFVYKHRSETIHRINKRTIFSKEVNNLQIRDARKLTTILNETKIVSIEELNRILDWPVSTHHENSITQFNEMINKAEAQGYSCTPFGALTNKQEHQKILVKSPITVALMLSYREVCEELSKDGDSHDRSLSFTLQACYITLALEAFDQKTIEDGKRIYDSHTFPKVIIE